MLVICVQESENLVKYVASSDWIEADGFKYLFASLYNVAVVLYRNKQMKEVHAQKDTVFSNMKLNTTTMLSSVLFV